MIDFHLSSSFPDAIIPIFHPMSPCGRTSCHIGYVKLGTGTGKQYDYCFIVYLFIFITTFRKMSTVSIHKEKTVYLNQEKQNIQYVHSPTSIHCRSPPSGLHPTSLIVCASAYSFLARSTISPPSRHSSDSRSPHPSPLSMPHTGPCPYNAS